MRIAKLILAIATLAAFAPSNASAQSLQDITSTARSADNAVRTLTYPCYGQGLTAILCRVERINSSVSQADYTARRYQRAVRADATSINLRDRNPNATLVLGRMCSQGDRTACNAVRAMRAEDQRLARQEASNSLPRSVMEACSTGSHAACDSIRRRIQGR